MKKDEERDLLKSFAKGEKHERKRGGRAVIYQRVSSKEQEFGFSPETQLDTCYGYAERKGFEVVRCFAGEYESAKSDTNRKRFNEMLSFVKNKKNRIDAVIVYSTSRFSRTGTASFSIVEELKKRGVTVYSATSSYDARTEDGEMLQGIELVQARHDNAVKSRAVRDNGAKALRSGHWITKAPLGYDMVTNKREQTITVNEKGVLIRRAFKIKAEENLTNEAVRMRMAAIGLNLTKQQWSRIFSNIFYAGYFSHPFLEGDVIEGPHEPLVSLQNFYKINGMVKESHSRGYEVKAGKEYAPLLGTLKCPVCGRNMTASLSTKMRRKYGREVGYYVCCHTGCRCNVPAKILNSQTEDLLECASLPQDIKEVFEAQLRRSFAILNKDGQAEAKDIKTNLANKENEIKKVEYNIATATNPKVLEICTRQLEKLEAEKEEIKKQLEERGKEILNLDEFISDGLAMKDNILKIYQLAKLLDKKYILKLAFPDGLVYNKENDYIEPQSRNSFLFVNDSVLDACKQNKNGQTAEFDDLSALAPQVGLEPTTP